MGRSKLALLVIAIVAAGGATGAILGLSASASERTANAGAPSTNELIGRLLTSPIPRIRRDAARRLSARLDPVLTRRVLRSAAPTPRGRLAIGLLRNRYVAIFRRSPARSPIRIKAIRALSVFDDSAAANVVAAALVGDPNAAVRRASSAELERMTRSVHFVVSRLVTAHERALGPRPEIDGVLVSVGAPAVERLFPLLPSSWAEAVIARIGAPALPLLREELAHGSSLQRRNVVVALVRMARLNPKATAGLIAALNGHDYGLLADLHTFYIRLGRPGSEGALIAALDARGNATMALDYLNSGNAKLDRGARDWAARQGYTVTSEPGPGPPPSWGTGGSL